MANTKVNTRLICNTTTVVQHFSLISDGTQETGTVIYSSSSVATALVKTDSKNCSIMSIRFSTNSPLGKLHLLFDATTALPAWALPYQSNEGEFCFKEDMGGLYNFTVTGRTGDILLTTTGLASGDVVTIALEVRPY